MQISIVEGEQSKRMPVLGILIILLLPILYGTFISRIFGDRKSEWSVLYGSGFLAMILALLFSVLVALKLDADLDRAAKIYFMVLGAGAVVALPFTIVSIRQKNMPKISCSFDKDNLWFLIPAIFLGAAVALIYVPSFVNDNTWEIVSTTLASKKIYEYSSMTGKAMEQGAAGLPIFNKIYVMPMFYTYFAYIFGLDMWLLGGIVVPAIIYAVNISLVYLISGEVSDCRKRPFFMITYMMLLMAGTYLPEKGIPITVGYAVLREGYTGYAACYGILAPLVLYWMLKKKRIRAWIMCFSVFGLVRLDRIAYSIREPFESLRQINQSGKLMGLYLLAAFAAFILACSRKEKIKWEAFLIPSVAISMVVTKLKSLVNGKAGSVVYSLGISILIFSCVIFRPFEDATTLNSFTKQDREVKTCLEEISEKVSDINLWAYEDFMFEARRIDGNVITLYGRDDMNVTMAGLDYEPESEFTSDYIKFIKNKSFWVDYMITEHSDEDIVKEACSEGVNTIVLPVTANVEGYESILNKQGFKLEMETSKSLVYIRKEFN